MKVSVYITARNYANFIEKAIQSVFAQTLSDWELIVINDGSTDNTSEILEKYQGHPKVRIIEQVRKGLNVSNNVALRSSKGKYIMRLDADDFLDENALLVLSNVLDTKPEAGLVYPDYYLIDEAGEIIEIVRRKKIGDEVELLDLPAHGACTMFRRECLLDLGGYSEHFDCHDGYELWLKFLLTFKPYNVNIPLFYYRQHSNNLTKNHSKILETRRKIKRGFVKDFKNNKIPRVLAVIPVIKQPNNSPDSAFSILADKPLIWYTLSEVSKTKMLDKVVISTNDDMVIDHAASYQGMLALRRPEALTRANTQNQAIVKDILSHLSEKEKYYPDAVMILYVNTPLRRVSHIEKAIDTMTIFNVDSVISVEEELSYSYLHGKYGLIPIHERREMRLEKNSIYKENSAVILSKVESITDKSFFGKRIGHIMMLPEESIKIKSSFSLWQAEKILTDWKLITETH